MIEIGIKNNLKILRDTSVGLFLGDEEGNDVLLPNKYVPESYEIGEEIEVFCYLDYDERPVATTLEPDIMLGEFRLLEVAEVNEFGAFMDWGLEKHLLVPFREQRSKMKQGQWYVVHCYLDEKTGRLVASNKLDKFLNNDNLHLKEWDEVDLVVTRQTDLGWEVIVNEKHKGLVYFNEVFKTVNIGDVIPGCVKKIRKDNKIDISLQPLGERVLEPAANKIFTVLKENGGYLPLHDKSDPEEIRDMLQMSKKTFKKGLGALYKARKVTLEDDGINLAE
ncbi:S1-like domain-containing RNA-binding protein [Maribacter sp. PR1]|uniref:S1-like domain-containing RNA-binding protein n=1 Tax=Maribacter cobaltidurans TaxID=1178778 RepID=A0ABU7IVX6_9FLAO|nr:MULTISPECIES: S1-like domain-containing RNA-binding protein [Maribacter]MDC6389737.1 S1-like domain-containing RNA-binding protein [Maribacter sp. PR1]MEE1977127.1 S1-like domain-containing RNA-binding protein [Maribacter cobaltidurans]